MPHRVAVIEPGQSNLFAHIISAPTAASYWQSLQAGHSGIAPLQVRRSRVIAFQQRRGSPKFQAHRALRRKRKSACSSASARFGVIAARVRPWLRLASNGPSNLAQSHSHRHRLLRRRPNHRRRGLRQSLSQQHPARKSVHYSAYHGKHPPPAASRSRPGVVEPTLPSPPPVLRPPCCIGRAFGWSGA